MAHGVRPLAALAGAVVLCVAGVGCGQDADPGTVDAAATDTSALDGAGGAPAFCDAVAALDETDGTTESTIVLAAIEEVRRTAPAEIGEDVRRSLDSLVLGNYPDAADASMREMSPEEREASADRMTAYVDEHCPDLDAG